MGRTTLSFTECIFRATQVVPVTAGEAYFHLVISLVLRCYTPVISFFVIAKTPFAVCFFSCLKTRVQTLIAAVEIFSP